MAVPKSSISEVCAFLKKFLVEHLDARDSGIDVLLGNPVDAVPTDNDDARINLFFHRVVPGGFGAQSHPGEPWLIRLYCLITAFAVREGEVSAGQNDLRLLGEVVRVFHETPVLERVEVNGEAVRLQVVFQPLSLDEINHLWSTQGDVIYRPSVLYEFALAPVVPKRRRAPSPLVGASGARVRGTMETPVLPVAGVAAPPPVLPVRVDVGRGDWTPHICFVRDGACAQTLTLREDEIAEDAELRVWVAGRTDTDVSLQWEVLDADGWHLEGDRITATPASEAIEPDQPLPVDRLLSINVPPVAGLRQALLRAVHTHQPHPDARERLLRSNPLLVTVLREAS